MCLKQGMENVSIEGDSFIIWDSIKTKGGSHGHLCLPSGRLCTPCPPFLDGTLNLSVDPQILSQTNWLRLVHRTSREGAMLQ